MARVTVEDCVDKIKNRFDLVLLAGQRSRQITSGAPLLVDRDNDKNPVVALREIADQKIMPEDLRESLIHSLQKNVEVDEPEEDDLTLLAAGRRARQTVEELTPEAIEQAAAALKSEDNEADSADGDDGTISAE